MAHRLRARSRYIISFGDCAVTGNVTSLRNPLGTALAVLRPVKAWLVAEQYVHKASEARFDSFGKHGRDVA